MKTIALILLLTLCGTSSAEISKITVNKAWKRITKAASFSRIPITYERTTPFASTVATFVSFELYVIDRVMGFHTAKKVYELISSHPSVQ